MKKEKIVTWIMVVLLTFYQIGIQTCAKENVALNNVCDENLISTEVREYFDENYQGLLKCFAQEHYNTNDLSAFVVEQPFIIYHYNLLENYILYFPISFKNRIYGIEAYSVWASLFTLAVVMVTMKVSIKSTALEWVGKRVFSIYILQRIPMIVLTKTGFTQNSPYAFLVLVFLITLGIAVIFDYVTAKIDNIIIKYLVKE